MVALIIALLFVVFSGISFAADVTVTNTYSVQAILDYDIDSTTLTAGTAAGAILSQTASEQDFEDLTGINYEDYSLSLQSLLESGSFDSSFSYSRDGVFNKSYYGNSPNDSYLFQTWNMPGFNNDGYLNLENPFTNLTPAARSAIFGSVTGWVSTNSVNYSIPDISFIQSSEFQDGFDIEDGAPFEFWTRDFPTPNLYFFNMTSIFDSSVAGDFSSWFSDTLSQYSSDSNGAFDLNMSEWFLDIADGIDSFFSDKVIPIVRPLVAGICLAVYWIIVAVFLSRNGAAVVDEVSSLFTGFRSREDK